MALHGKAVSGGSPIGSGNLRVLVYDSNLGGNLVYDSNSDFDSKIVNGFFDVILGSGAIALDLNYGSVYYMDLLVNGQDLNFNGEDRRPFESSRGPVIGSSIMSGTITNAQISGSAAIDWSKISKSGSELSDLGFDSDFNGTYLTQIDANSWFVKAADMNLVYYTQADANNVLLNKVDANLLYARKDYPETINGNWNFSSQFYQAGGFGSGGITFQNGIGYFQSLVVLNDFNAATVTGIDLNGHYLPDPDNTWDLGSALRRFRKIYSADANIGSAYVGSLSLGNPLGVSSGGTGAASFTPGQLVYYNGSVLTGDSSLFWDSALKRLGVGTSLPSSALNVVGDSNLAGNLLVGQNNLFVNSASGRVGVGTASPQNTLNVVGDLNVTGVSYLGNVVISADDINVNRVNSRDGNISFNSLGSEIMRAVGSSGNVGIGISQPTSRLHVAGDINVTGNAYLDLDWVRLKNYPSGCASGQYVTAVGDTLTCTNIPGGGAGRTYIGYSPVVIDNDLNTIALDVLPSSDWNGLFDGFDSNYYLNFGNLTDRNFSMLRLDSNASYDARYVKISDTNNAARVNYGAIGGLSPGGVTFGSAAGILSQDGNFYWDAALDRLGIGTQSPQNTLNIIGDLNVVGSIYGGISGTGILVPAYNVRADGNATFGAGSYVFPNDLNVNGQINANVLAGRDSNSLALQTSNTTRLAISADGNVAIDTNVLFVDPANNRVGIGTSNPLFDMHVFGADPVYAFERSGFWRLRFESTSGEPEIFSEDIGTGEGHLILQQSSAGGVGIGGEPIGAKLYVSGNVGLGTPISNNRLNVIGDLNVISSAAKRYPSLFVAAADGNTGIRMVPGAGYALDVNGNLRVTGDMNVTGTAYINNISGFVRESVFNSAFPVSLDTNVSGTLPIVRGGTNATDFNAGALVFYDGNRLTSNTALYFNRQDQRLGIRTQAPSSALDVNGDLNVTAPGNAMPSIYARPTDGNVGINTIGGYGYRLDVNGNMRVGQDINVLGNVYSNGQLIGSFWTSAGNNIYNSNPGNVGIGTGQNIQNKLNIIGDLNVLGSPSATQPSLYVRQGDGNVGINTVPAPGLVLDVNGNMRVQGDFNIGGATNITGGIYGFTPGSVIFANGAGRLSEYNEKFYWDYDNNRLGIGSRYPQTALDVVGDANITGGLLVAGTATANAVTANSRVTTGQIHAPSDTLGFYDSLNNLRMTFDGSIGALGIGTPTPQQEFEIASSYPTIRLRSTLGAASTAQPYIEFGGTNAGNWESMGFVGNYIGGLQTIDVWGGSGTVVRLGANNAEALRVGTDLNVGIGTTSPYARLAVTGDFKVMPSASSGYPSMYVGPDGNTGIRMMPRDGYALDVNGLAGVGGDLNVAGNVYSNGALLSRSYWTLDGNGLYPNSIDYNVGIGTLVPGSKLDVNGSVSVQQPTVPTIKGSVSSGDMGGANHIVVSGRYAYVTSRGADKFSIVDVADPANPIFVSSASGFNAPEGVAVAGNYAYVVSSMNNALYVVDVSSPSFPSVVGSVADAKLAYAAGISVQGQFAYVSVDTDKWLTIIDISNPRAPKVAGAIRDIVNLANSRKIFVNGKYAYVASAGGLFTIVDVSNPSIPSIAGSLSDGNLSSSYGLFVSGKYAYIGANNGLTVVDVSDPSNPVYAGSVQGAMFSTGGDVFVSGRYAFVTNYSGDGLVVVDVSNPYSPYVVGSVTDGTYLNGAQDVFVSGKYAYVAAGNFQGLAVVDLAGVETPTASIGALNAGSATIDTRLDVGASANIRGGLNVGPGGIYSQGKLAIVDNSLDMNSSILSVIDSDAIQAGATNSKFGVYQDANVGIGTLYPRNKLNVLGDMNVSLPTGTGLPSFIVRNTDNNVGINTLGGYGYRLDVNGNVRVANDLNVVGNVYANGALLGQSYWTLNSNKLYPNSVDYNVGVGTVSPVAKLDVNGGILAQGAVGGVPVSGVGRRFMWVPERGALRAGGVSGAAWDSGSIGLYSVGFGYDANASNNYSIAMGYATTASGGYSIAMGDQAVASGSNSIAMGFAPDATGNYSVAIGSNSNATGLISTAIGFANTASGDYSSAIGRGGTARALNSVAIGTATDANSFDMLALGIYNVTGAYNQTAWVSSDPLVAVGMGSSPSDRRNALTILKDGNVGVGVTAPIVKLDVNGSERVVGDLNVVTGFNALRPSLFVRSADGNVGVNTYGGAGYRLDVNGNVRVANDLNVVGNVYANGALLGQSYWTLNSNKLYPNSVDYNVGIGTDSPSANLDVNGAGRIRGGPDLNGLYVSSSGYVGIGTSGLVVPLQVRGSAILENTTGPTLSIYNNNSFANSAAGTIEGGIEFSARLNNSDYLETSRIRGVYDGNGITRVGSLLLMTSNGGQPVERMKITGDGNVGINSSNPFGKLNVVGDVNVIRSAAYGVPSFYIRASDGNVGVNTVGGAGYRLDVNGNMRVVNDLNVLGNIYGAISGSTILVPAYNVRADGNATFGAGNYVFPSDLNVLGVIRGDLNTNVVQSADGNIVFRGSTGVQRMIVASDGNVGVGISSPSNMLSVGGRAGISDNLYVGAQSSPWNTAFYVVKSDNNDQIPVAVFNGSANGQNAVIDIRSSTSGGSGRHVALVNNAESGLFHIANWTAGSSVPNLTINYISGLVGIKNTNPRALLDVNGSERVVGDLNVVTGFNAVSPSLFVRSADGNVGVNTYGGAGYRLDVNGNMRVSNDLNVVGNLYANGQSVGAAGSTGQLQFNNAGGFGADANLYWDSSNDRLGIATGSPQYNLDVNGTIRQGNSSSYMSIAQIGGGTQFITNSGKGFFFYPGNSPEFVINSTGQVAINTTSPSVGSIFDINANSQNMVVTSDGNVVMGGTSSINRLNVVGDLNVIPSRTAALPAFFVRSGDGNVGMNTVGGAGYRLDVNGNMRVSNDLNVVGNVYANGQLLGGQWATNGNNIYNTNSGNVGVGVTNPNYKLDVNGQLNVRTVTGMATLTTTSDGNVGVKTTSASASLDVNGAARVRENLQADQNITMAATSPAIDMGGGVYMQKQANGTLVISNG